MSDQAEPVTAAQQIVHLVRRLRIIPTVPVLILLALCLLGVFAPLIAPYSATEGSLRDKLMPPAWVAGGSWTHPLGTDLLGRDILSRLIYGARTSFTVAALAVFFAGTVGTILGLISGYFGGLTDILLMRLTDIALSVPLILMAIILVAALGTSFTNVILVIVLLLWPRYARQVRGETLSIKERDFVEIGRAHV
jgi:peptide/nickel transport system permease protein